MLKRAERAELVLQGYFRVDPFRREKRLIAPNAQTHSRLSLPTRSRAQIPHQAIQPRPLPSTPRAPRPDLLPNKLLETVVQAKPQRGASSPWSAAPRPDLLPGMAKPWSATTVQTRGPGGITITRVPPARLRSIGDGRPLAPEFRRAMESFFQADFSEVRIHEGPAVQAIGALAFTLGDDIHVAPGLYDPATREGTALLGHELTHVLQQREGRVTNPFGHGIAIVQDPDLEAEADRMGQRIADEMWSGLPRTPYHAMAKPVVPDRGSPPPHRVVALPQKRAANLTQLSRRTVQRMEQARVVIEDGDPGWCFNKGVRVLSPDQRRQQARTKLINVLGRSRFAGASELYVAIVRLWMENDEEMRAIVTHPEGPDPRAGLPEDLKEMLLDDVDYVLQSSGEMTILREYWRDDAELAFEVHLDYYDQRPLAQAGFHKDTLGSTMFINLAFANEKTVWGPEWIIDFDVDNPENSWPWEHRLPQGFTAKLAEARVSWSKRKDKQKFKIWIEAVPPCGTVCFNDALIIHSTPLLKHRTNSDADAGAEAGQNPRAYNYGEFRVSAVGYDPSPSLNLGTGKESRKWRRFSKRIEGSDKDFPEITKDTLGTKRSFLRHEVRRAEKTVGL